MFPEHVSFGEIITVTMQAITAIAVVLNTYIATKARKQSVENAHKLEDVHVMAQTAAVASQAAAVEAVVAKETILQTIEANGHVRNH